MNLKHTAMWKTRHVRGYTDIFTVYTRTDDGWAVLVDAYGVFCNIE